MSARAWAAGACLLLTASAGALSWTREAEPIPGRGLAALIQRPRTARPRRLAALIVIGGLETGARVLDLLAPDQPVALATFEYPYQGPRKFHFPRTLLDAPKIKAAVAGTPLDVEALHRLLLSKPYVDPGRACVVGASFGAPFALRAAADDPDICCLVLVQGFADVKSTAAHRMRQLWEGRLGILTRPLAWLASRALAFYLDWPAPEEDAPRLREGQRVLVVEASGDTMIPAASRELLWSSLRRSRARATRVQLPGEHLLAGRSRRDIQEIARVVERWIPVEAATSGD